MTTKLYHDNFEDTYTTTTLELITTMVHFPLNSVARSPGRLCTQFDRSHAKRLGASNLGPHSHSLENTGKSKNISIAWNKGVYVETRSKVKKPTEY